MKKDEAQEPIQTPVTPPPSNTLAIVSLVMGIISLTGPGLLLGIPAIITGAIALKKKQAERGLSIAGIITGSISTAFSLVLIIIFIAAFIWGLNNPYPDTHEPSLRRDTPPSREMLFERS